MPSTLPSAAPDSVTSLLWVALIVIVPALLTAIGFLWRRSEALRDAYQTKTDEALEKERAQNEKHTKAIQDQAAAIERHTEAVDKGAEAYLAVSVSLKELQATMASVKTTMEAVHTQLNRRTR